MTLRELHIGQSATILKVGGEGALRQHFLDMGMIPGTQVTLQKYAPLGDPMELRVHGYELTLRLADAERIEVAPSPLPLWGSASKDAGVNGSTPPKGERGGGFPHPGFGEEGRYHEEDAFHPISSAKKGPLTFALVGNQNCGKTTLFNQLTGSKQHVGNFPGVTIDRKDGIIKGYPDCTITDLPGIYSLSPYTSEEVISRRFILENKPSGIINIVDATNIERNLYLTMQLMELGIPMVLALNMMDEVRSNGGTIRINRMERLLGIPVIPISAMKNEGVDEVVSHAIHVARYNEGPARQDFCSPTEHGGAVHRCLHAIMHFIEDHAQAADRRLLRRRQPERRKRRLGHEARGLQSRPLRQIPGGKARKNRLDERADVGAEQLEAARHLRPLNEALRHGRGRIRHPLPHFLPRVQRGCGASLRHQRDGALQAKRRDSHRKGRQISRGRTAGGRLLQRDPGLPPAQYRKNHPAADPGSGL